LTQPDQIGLPGPVWLGSRPRSDPPLPLSLVPHLTHRAPDAPGVALPADHQPRWRPPPPPASTGPPSPDLPRHAVCPASRLLCTPRQPLLRLGFRPTSDAELWRCSGRLRWWYNQVGLLGLLVLARLGAGGDVVVLVGCCGGGTAAVPDCPTASTPVGRRVPRNPGDANLLPNLPTLRPRRRRNGAADATPASPPHAISL
jgi:hypothetical protein